MGRAKIEIKKIENLRGRKVTFIKRRDELLKKAEELTILCDAEVAVIVFSETGKLYEFASTCMAHIFSRYADLEEAEQHQLSDKPPAQFVELDTTILQEEITKLRSDYLRMKGKELDGLGLKELQDLENQLSEGISAVKYKKEQVLFEQLEKSRLQDQEAMAEIKALRKQLEEIENKSKVEFKEIHRTDRRTASINSSNPPLEPYLLLRL